ncbi:hypothetical protein Gotri_019294, partial [Gossypium trilobum]|nr:hypothetical protein [Gossypium trilobum]
TSQTDKNLEQATTRSYSSTNFVIRLARAQQEVDDSGHPNEESEEDEGSEEMDFEEDD